MPLYEVVLEQRFFNQQSINRWNYLGSGTPAAVVPSFALLTALGFIGLSTSLTNGTVGGELQDLQNPEAIFVHATCRAIYIDADFYDNPFLAGTVGQSVGIGEAMGPTNAFGYRSNRVKQSIGRGFKRFVGMADGDTLGGGIITSTTRTQMELLKDAMNAVLTYDDEGNTLSFAPCVAQKEKYTTPSGKFAYKYYATELLQAPHLAVGIAWEAYQQERTQVSRQYARGS
jgi:hypothetical protein